MASGVLTVNQGTNQGILIDSAGTVDIGVVKLDTSAAGTFGSLWNGTVGVNSLPNIPGGTINAGTVQLSGGTLNLGSITGNVGVSSGTITTLPNIPGGTVNLTQAIGTIGTLGLGTVVITTLPNLPQGSITVTAGTIATLGTMGTLGLLNTVTTVSNLSNGTLGTIGTLGLVNTVTTVSNLTNGSIHVTAGTEVITSGSISVIAGTIASDTIVGGTLNLGTFVGKDANAVAQTGNPISIGGTDSGGTVRTVLVNSSGAMSVTGASAGTFVNLSTGTLNAGTINVGTTVNQFSELTGSATGGTATIIGTTDVSQYKWMSLQMKNTYVGTVNVLVSNDNSNYYTYPVTDLANQTGGQITNISGTSIYIAPIMTRYLEVLTGAYTSGTAQAVMELYSYVPNPQVESDNLVTKLAGEDLTNDVMKVEQRFSYNYISTAATTTVKSGSGFLHSITVEGGTGGTITIFDNTAGSGANIGVFDSTSNLTTYIFDVSFTTGLTIVTSAATKLTVSYR